MSDTNLVDLILNNIFRNETYVRQVIPFLKSEYFEGHRKELFDTFYSYFEAYNDIPTRESFRVSLDERELPEKTLIDCVEHLDLLYKDFEVSHKWLVEKTEKWCQDRAVLLAIMDSISIIDGKSKTLKKDAIPKILSDALAVSFDSHIGHDYIDNAQERFDYYQLDEERIPFDLEIMNLITKGGVSRKALAIILAGTGVGKSLAMCHMAAANLSYGKNVLYITLEMAEQKCAERIDANLFDRPINEIENMTHGPYMDAIDKLKAKTNGKLIIKEYPTSQAHTGHFRALLNELAMKKGFIPDIIYIDYLNICASSRIRGLGGSVNTYSYIKAIAEEIRGLAVEFNVPIVSATQTNRSGFSNSDPGLEDTSESFGLPATADLMFALVSNEELDASNLLMVKQLKNRYNDPNFYRRFVLGIDKAKMKLYDVDQNDQNTGVSRDHNDTRDSKNDNDTPPWDDDVPVFDRGTSHSGFGDFKTE
jgi:hypothetical protein